MRAWRARGGTSGTGGPWGAAAAPQKATSGGLIQCSIANDLEPEPESRSPRPGGEDLTFALLANMDPNGEPATRFPRFRTPYPKALCSNHDPSGSVVPVHALPALMALLGLEAEGGDRPGVETGEADGLARILAVTIGPVVDAA